LGTTADCSCIYRRLWICRLPRELPTPLGLPKLLGLPTPPELPTYLGYRRSGSPDASGFADVFRSTDVRYLPTPLDLPTLLYLPTPLGLATPWISRRFWSCRRFWIHRRLQVSDASGCTDVPRTPDDSAVHILSIIQSDRTHRLSYSRRSAKPALQHGNRRRSFRC